MGPDQCIHEIGDLIQVGGVKGHKWRLTLTWIEVGKKDVLNRELIEYEKEHDFGYDKMTEKTAYGWLPLVDGDL
jgi:hypothetical protein